jgi:hypothetical protein
MTEERITNKSFAESDVIFKRICENIGNLATPRQASKFRNKKGKAYRVGILKHDPLRLHEK